MRGLLCGVIGGYLVYLAYSEVWGVLMVRLEQAMLAAGVR